MRGYHRRIAAIAIPLLSVLTEADVRALSRAAGWMSLMGVFAFTFEIACRIEDWIRFRTPLVSPVVSWMDLIVSDEHGIHGRPNSRFQKWTMNELGMRGPAATQRKPAATVRIIATGASETFGLYESPGREFPRQLEDTLNARLAAGQCREHELRRFEVLNAALPGLSLPTLAQNLIARMRDLGVDVVILYPTPTQYLNDEPPRPARSNSFAFPTTFGAVRALRPRSLDRIRGQVKELLPDFARTSVQLWLRQRELNALIEAKPPGWRFTTVPNDRLAQYDRDLRAFIGTVRSTGVGLVIATHANAFMRPNYTNPSWLAESETFYPRATAPVVVAFDSIARHLTLKVAADSSVPVIDLARRLSQEDPPQVFRDLLHFTDLGAARTATALVPAVMAAMRTSGLCSVD